MSTSTEVPGERPLQHSLHPVLRGCETCGHRSDCSTHSAPAFPSGPCDCGLLDRLLAVIHRNAISNALNPIGGHDKAALSARDEFLGRQVREVMGHNGGVR